LISKQITIRVNGDCDPFGRAEAYKLALVISLFFQMLACRNILDLGRFDGPSVDCPLHSMLVVVDSVFISSNYALQEAIIFVSYRRKSGYAFAQSQSLQLLPYDGSMIWRIAGGHALKVKGEYVER
jgi:hypothetical protein